MSLFTRAFIQEGDHVVTASATFIGFLVLANIQGADIERVPLTPDYRFDVKAIAAAVNEKTKVIYIANPNNPTGTIITRNEYEWLLNNTPDHVLIVMDEAYYEYAKDSEEYPDSLQNPVPRVITFRTFSKAYGLAGLRAGYAIGDEVLIGIMTRIKPPFDPSVVAQYAAKSALQDQDFIAKSVGLVNEGRQQLYHFLEEHEVDFVKSYSNSVMIPFGSETKAEAFTLEMMKKGVILRRLPGFGLANCVRVTIGLPEEMNYFEEKFDEVWPTL
jgi:histidinol-phosphate aminotransferase